MSRCSWVPPAELEAMTGNYVQGATHVTISARDGRAWLTVGHRFLLETVFQREPER